MCNFFLQIQTNVIDFTEKRFSQVARDVYCHLNNQITRNRIFHWNADDLTCKPQLPFLEMKERGIRMILKSIENEVELYCKKEEVNNISSECENKLLEGLLLFDEQSKDVRKLIRSYRVPDSELKNPYECNILSKVLLGTLILLTAPVWYTAYIISIPYAIFKDDVYNLVMGKQKMSEFNSKPLEILKKWCDDILLQHYNENAIYIRFSCTSIQRIRQKTQYVCGYIIPQQINADEIFIKNVTNDIRSYKEIRKLYLPIGEKAKVIMGKFYFMQMQYFSNNSVASANLRNCSPTNNWEGTFANLHVVEIYCAHKWVEAVVKTMKQPLRSNNSFIQLMEVDSLR